MNKTKSWARTLYIMGAVGVVVGAIDPLEGSVLITVASGLMALSTGVSGDRHRRVFLLAFLQILFGVGSMIYISTLGGLGAGQLSWWWGLFIAPYPAGWILTVIYIVKRLLKPKMEV